MTEVVAHRGWPVRYPENTMAGILAVSGIADVVEMDVRRSADGKLVLAHDPWLDGHLISENEWSFLAELDLGEGHHPALLDEVLAAIPDTPAQLEVKNDPAEPGFEPDHRLGLEVAERARPGDIVTSFNARTIARVRREFPDVPTGLAVDATTDLVDSIEHCRAMGHEVLVPWVPLLTEPVPADIAVYPWTVNDEDLARELVQLGVSGIITDDAQAIAEALKEIR